MRGIQILVNVIKIPIHYHVTHTIHNSNLITPSAYLRNKAKRITYVLNHDYIFYGGYLVALKLNIPR